MPDTPESPDLASNKALVRAYFAAIDSGDAAIIATFLAPDYVEHASAFPNLRPGVDGVHDVFRLSNIAFTNFKHVIEDQVAEGDRVVTRVTATGDHVGDYWGVAATGKTVSMEGIAIHRIADGKIAEHWGKSDLYGLLQRMKAPTA
jgi:steroid delta-isomerase-like uncharacterized protein